MSDLTDRQAEVIDNMVEHFESFGVWPSVRELGKMLGGNRPLSLNAVSGHLKALIIKGFVKQAVFGSSRGYRVVRLTDGRRVASRLVPIDNGAAR
jgi:SOS-response transcriptional repressor LexA